jgi:hypothetical protein
MLMKRIYFHFIEGDLDAQIDLKNHLAVYLQGFEELGSAYSPYPDALLYLKFISKIGSIVTRLSTEIEKDTSNEKNNSNDDKKYDEQKLLSPFLLSAINLHYSLKKRVSNESLQLCLKNLHKISSNINYQNWLVNKSLLKPFLPLLKTKNESLNIL